MKEIEIEIPAPDFDGYYSVRPVDDGYQWCVTVFCDGFRHGGQYAKEWEVDMWFDTADEAIKWCEAHYKNFLMEGLEE